MYYFLKALANSLLLPPSGPLLVSAVGAVLIRRRRGRLGWTLLVAGLISCWPMATPLVADTLSALAEHYPPLDPNSRTGAQAIVVLGGGGERGEAPEYGGPAAGLVLLERLTYGAFLARRTGLPLLVTGTPLEARVMRVTLSRNFGLPTHWVEDRSRDTYDNAQYSLERRNTTVARPRGPAARGRGDPRADRRARQKAASRAGSAKAPRRSRAGQRPTCASRRPILRKRTPHPAQAAPISPQAVHERRSDRTEQALQLLLDEMQCIGTSRERLRGRRYFVASGSNDGRLRQVCDVRVDDSGGVRRA